MPPTSLPRCLRSFVATLAIGLCACASVPEEEEPNPADQSFGEWTSETLGTMGRAVRDGAGAVGRGAGTAYTGLSKGYRAPSSEADFGSFPADYVEVVKKHFVRIRRVSKEAGFSFGAPRRGYVNRGLLQGGGIAWRGYVVDVEVTTRRGISRQRATLPYVVRLRDGEVVEVHENDTLIGRL